jgi:hypothetical protein
MPLPVLSCLLVSLLKIERLPKKPEIGDTVLKMIYWFQKASNFEFSMRPLTFSITWLEFHKFNCSKYVLFFQ